ncbi:MAG: carbohydrate ABC transporter permease [Spirochaetota bacterium]
MLHGLHRRGTARLATFLLLPALTGLLVFYYVPVVQSALLSLFDLRFSLTPTGESFLGLGNYGRALASAEFARALGFTLVFAVCAVTLDLTLGMLFALATFWVDRRLRNVLRAIIIIPWAIPNVIQASIWRWLFNTDVGLVGDILVRTGIAASPPLFLANAGLAFVAMIWAYVWKGASISAIFCMAGLATVPRELQEAARMDGAGALRRFFSITVPTMLPVLVVALIFRSRDALRVFDLVFGLTRGGPGGATETLSSITYKTYFSFNQYGLGSAYAIISFVLIFSVAVAYLGRVRGRLSAEGDTL